MTSILLCSLIVSLFCLGLKISTGEGMLLEFVKVKLDVVFIVPEYSDDRQLDMSLGVDKKVLKLYYPILYCIKCMPSIYGTIISFILLPLTIHLAYQIPLVIFCSVTLNCIFYQMYE